MTRRLVYIKDKNPIAEADARATARANGFPVKTTLMPPQVDVIIANLPMYVPDSNAIVKTRGYASIWDRDEGGRAMAELAEAFHNAGSPSVRGMAWNARFWLENPPQPRVDMVRRLFEWMGLDVTPAYNAHTPFTVYFLEKALQQRPVSPAAAACQKSHLPSGTKPPSPDLFHLFRRFFHGLARGAAFLLMMGLFWSHDAPKPASVSVPAFRREELSSA